MRRLHGSELRRFYSKQTRTQTVQVCRCLRCGDASLVLPPCLLLRARWSETVGSDLFVCASNAKFITLSGFSFIGTDVFGCDSLMQTLES